MSAQVGWKMKLKRDGTVIAGLKSKSWAVNNEPIDITSDDDSGIRTLLEDSGVRSIDFSFEGVFKDDVIVADVISGTLLIKSATLEFPLQSGDSVPATITGDFRLNSLSQSGVTNDQITYSGELQSTGAFAYTAAT